MKPLTLGGLAVGHPQPVDHEAIHAGLLDRVVDGLGKVLEILVGVGNVVAGRTAVAEFGMEFGPAWIRGGAEVTEDLHVLLVTQLHHFSEEVVLEARLLGNKTVLVPSVAVGRHREGLNDIRTHGFVPRHVGSGIGSGPLTRLGEGSAAAVGRRPVEIQTVGLDGLLPPLCPGGHGRQKQGCGEGQAESEAHDKITDVTKKRFQQIQRPTDPRSGSAHPRGCCWPDFDPCRQSLGQPWIRSGWNRPRARWPTRRSEWHRVPAW